MKNYITPFFNVLWAYDNYYAEIVIFCLLLILLQYIRKCYAKNKKSTKSAFEKNVSMRKIAYAQFLALQ